MAQPFKRLTEALTQPEGDQIKYANLYNADLRYANLSTLNKADLKARGAIL